MSRKIGKVALYAALFLLVPFVLGRVLAAVLQAVDPPSAYGGLVEELQHVRAQTRLILLIIAGYYVALVAALVGQSVLDGPYYARLTKSSSALAPSRPVWAQMTTSMSGRCSSSASARAHCSAWEEDRPAPVGTSPTIIRFSPATA